MPRSCLARSRGASSGASHHSPTETAPGEQTRPAVWAEGLSRTSHTSSPNSTLSPVPVRHREQDGLSPPLQCPTDQKVVAEELGQLHADDVFIQGQQVEGPFIAGDICVWDRDRGQLRSPGQKEPQESQQPQNRACGAPDRMGGRTLSPLLRQKRGANAVAGTHLPTSQQPASREPVFPAHLSLPTRGSQHWDLTGILRCQLPRASSAAPLTTKDPLFLQHHLASIELEGKGRCSGPGRL